MNQPVLLALNDLPKYTLWPQRLLSLEPFPIRYKTEQEVLREFQTEKWGFLLEQARAMEAPTLAAIEQLEVDLSAVEPFYEAPNFFLASGQYARDRHLSIYSDVLSKYAKDASCLVELGAGYGAQLLTLAQKDPFAHLSLFAAEFTRSGCELIRLLSQQAGQPVAVGHCDFRNLVLEDINIPENALIFTSYSVHYVPELAEAFPQFLARLKPRAVVHFEPCYECFRPETLHGLMCQRYMVLNDYTRNLLTVLKASQQKQEIQLLNVRENVIGSNPLLPISIIEWAPLHQ